MMSGRAGDRRQTSTGLNVDSGAWPKRLASYLARGSRRKVTWQTCVAIRSLRRALAGMVSDEDILDAYVNPTRVFELDEGFTMVIGANQAAIIYEIGVVDGRSAPVIVHAMRAREKFLR